jgi:uncharacterized protein
MIKRGQEIISEEEIVCKTIRSQARGLMFRRKKHNLIMILPKERNISLHMFFVFYPIDVILLNKDKKVMEIKENFKPFTFWNSKNKGKYLIELGKEHSKIEMGEVLEF